MGSGMSFEIYFNFLRYSHLRGRGRALYQTIKQELKMDDIVSNQHQYLNSKVLIDFTVK